jgi:hypothetical protein
MPPFPIETSCRSSRLPHRCLCVILLFYFPVTAFVLAIAPPELESPSMNETTEKSPVFHWKAVPGAVEYIVEIRRTPNGEPYRVSAGNQLSFKLHEGDLMQAAKYQWTVKGIAKSGESAVSKAMHFSTSPSAGSTDNQSRAQVARRKDPPREPAPTTSPSKMPSAVTGSSPVTAPLATAEPHAPPVRLPNTQVPMESPRPQAPTTQSPQSRNAPVHSSLPHTTPVDSPRQEGTPVPSPPPQTATQIRAPRW